MHDAGFIVPQWQGSPRIRALFTTRAVDVPSERLRAALPADPIWLTQVHGNTCVDVDTVRAPLPPADAAVTRIPNVAINVRTADCLPVLFGDRGGTVVGVAHAGWRGLAAGVLESTVATLGVAPDELAAWIGPAIGPERFEVGRDVFDTYCATDASCAVHFRPLREGKWLADLPGLAKQRLLRAGVARIDGGTWCTHTDAERFHSYRREKGTGRMALVAWLVEGPPRSLRSLPPEGAQPVPRGGPSELAEPPRSLRSLPPEGAQPVPRGGPSELAKPPRSLRSLPPEGAQPVPRGGPPELA